MGSLISYLVLVINTVVKTFFSCSSDQLFNLLISIFIVVLVRNDRRSIRVVCNFVLYTVQCTLRRIACIGTQGDGTCHQLCPPSHNQVPLPPPSAPASTTKCTTFHHQVPLLPTFGGKEGHLKALFLLMLLQLISIPLIEIR